MDCSINVNGVVHLIIVFFRKTFTNSRIIRNIDDVDTAIAFRNFDRKGVFTS